MHEEQPLAASGTEAPQHAEAPGHTEPAPPEVGSAVRGPVERYSGGAGLFPAAATEHGRGAGAFPSWAGVFVGAAAAVLAVAVLGGLVALNPAISEGRAAGTADQIGQMGVASGGAEAPGEVTGDAAEGKKLIGAKGCGGCHVVPGIAAAKGSIGPSLAGVAGRSKIAGGAVNNTGPEDLKKWIENPPGLKPGTAMPNLGLSDDEATKIVAYLELLGGGGASKGGAAKGGGPAPR